MIGKKAEFAIFFWNGTKRRNREKAKKKKRVQARIYVYTYMCVYTKKDEKWGERDTRLTRLLEMGQYLKVDRVDSGVVRRCVLFRVIGAIRVVVNIRQRATRPELIPQVNVQVFAAGLRWAGAGTLHGQRSLQYPGSRGTGTHRAARRVDLSRSIVRIGHQLDRFLRQSTLSCLSSCTLIHVYTRVR